MNHFQKMFQKAINSEITAEREACAKLADDHKCAYDCYGESLDGSINPTGNCNLDIASEIRARKNK